MGSSKSKLTVLSYEEAEKRLSEKEINRLRRAFALIAPRGTLSLEKFYSVVFGEYLPFSICETVFNALKIGSNSNGISFKELVIGIIILTGGSYEEKCRFIFSLYCNESGTGIDWVTLQGAIDNISDVNDLHMAQNGLDENCILSIDNFMIWIGQCPKFNEITYWLLLLECPQSLIDFSAPQDLYQLVAGVTHLDETEVVQLEKTYQRLVADIPRRMIDLSAFSSLVCPPLPETLVKKVFSTFDENEDGNIDLRELACGISACTRGPSIERKKFCCKIFDDDKDGRLTTVDIKSIFTVCNELKCDDAASSTSLNSKTEKSDTVCYDDLLHSIISSNEMTNNKSISIDDFLIWMNNYDFIDPLMDLLNQICTVMFNLRPQSGFEEEQIITKWLSREEKSRSFNYTCLYVISKTWLRLWLNHMRNVSKENNGNLLPNDSTSGSKVTYSKSLNNVLPLVRKHQYDLTKPSKFPLRVKSNDELIGKYTLHTSIDGPCNNVDMVFPDLASRVDFGSYTGSNNSISSFSSSSSFQDITPSNKCVPISNQCLLNTKIIPVNPNIIVYTEDGGILDPAMRFGEEYEFLPGPIWNCFKSWYGGGPTIPRPVWITNRPNEIKSSPFHDNCVILSRNQKVIKIEIHLLTLFIMRHVLPSVSAMGTVATLNKVDSTNVSMTVSSSLVPSGYHNNQSNSLRNVAIPKKLVRGRISLSRRTTLNELIEFLSTKLKINRDEMRIWKVIEENNLLQLEDEERVLDDLELENYDKILVEQRNNDLTWPEELNQLAKIRSLQNKKASSFKGVTGLSNIGNTCFFNSALQCISNTNILTDYFIREIHLCELNRTNSHGCNGMVALRYAELMKDIWSGSSNLIVPLKLKMTIDRYVQQFSGNQQHDAQEFLSALLDSLHEDLNRVKEKPSYKELKDSDGRSDEEVASEAWQSHIETNQSIIVDLFHGMLKSNVCCDICKNNSVRFDAYSMLSLPIPMQTSREIDILVFSQNSPVPRKHCVVVNSVEISQSFIRDQLSKQLSIDSQLLLLTLIEDDKIKKFLSPPDKILLSQTIYAYIIGDGYEMDKSADPSGVKDDVMFVIYHRRMTPRENYFLAHSRLMPEIFSYPIVFTVKRNDISSLSNKTIYEKVLSAIDRQNDIKFFVPDSNNNCRALHQISNHAVDCDSIDLVQPFKLSLIGQNGRQCSQCHWSKFCRGCTLPCSEEIYPSSGAAASPQYVALDWSPAAFHLRFNSENEKMFIFHSDYKEIKSMNNQPMDLLKCIEIFTTEEALGKDTLYQCTKCKKPQPAHKKLDLWTLPSVLIVHLKRFQCVDNRWQKSHKIVHYPIRNLDLNNFVKTSKKSQCGDSDSSGPSNDNRSFYNLYAVNCHLGNLQMGHYITYARNKETGKWYMFNDSICKEVNEKDVNTSSAYLLFYERANTDFEKVLDGLADLKAPVQEATEVIADEVDTDIKKYCCIQ